MNRHRHWRAELAHQLARATGTALILAGLVLLSAHLAA